MLTSGYIKVSPTVAELERRIVELERENERLRDALRRPIVIYTPVREPTLYPWYSPYTPVWDDGYTHITCGDTIASDSAVRTATTTSSKLTKE